MFPHERSLVKRLADKPFALIGVNTDGDREKTKEKNKEQQITWRSFWDGSTDGPICKSYNVQAFPTIYVLDHKGVIRYKGVREKAMDEAVDALLKELETEQKK